MNIKLLLLPIRWLAMALAFNLGTGLVCAQGTAFTYQGRLTDNGSGPTANYDLRFTLYTSAVGNVVSAGPVTNSATGVTNGIFTTTLDFGATTFSGAVRWLEIAVRTNGGAFTNLSPRQQLTSTPYAIRAANYSGSITVGQLPATVARLDTAQNFAAPVTFLSATGSFAGAFAGTLSGNGVTVTNVRWTTLDGEGGLSFVPGSLFLPGSSPTVGSGPRALASGDVNNDGRLDLISANSADNTLTVLTNNGLGGFAPASAPPVGAGPRSVAAVDVNADGRLDLVSANFDANTVSVLTNNGSGVFIPASTNSVGNNPHSVVVADVNADGRPDLISANLGSSTLTILTNKGGGTFALAASNPVGGSPIFVAAADVNGDGRPDLISANTGPNTLSVLTNNGSGGFVLATSPGVGGSPYSIATADVNGDGRIDLISANFGSSSLTILTNNGGGTFVTASTVGVGSGPVSVTSADVNADGRPDLISANSTDVNQTLSVLTNAGNGLFVLAVMPNVGPAPNAVLAVDVNRDGAVDLISANLGGGNLTLLFNTLAPRFNTFITVAGNITSGGQITAVLFNGNGAGLTNLNAAALATGTVPDARLAANVARLNASPQTFTGTNIFTRVGIGTNTPTESLSVSGNILASGTVTGSSDRNVKRDFSAVDSRAVLAKVLALPITTWSYQADAGVRHLGPMAQDFSAAFALGLDDKHISMVDADGVALAAIQGLNQKLEAELKEQRAAAQQKDERITALERELSEIKRLIEKLAASKR